MSKNSAKQNYEQLMYWLSDFNKSKTVVKPSSVTLSRIDYLKSQGVR
jgi:hypothetical protein